MVTASALTTFEGWEMDTAIEEDPRLRDIDVAVRGGMSRPRNVRQLIERNRRELEIYGSLEARCTVQRGRNQHGETGTEVLATEYWLTEEQALALVGFMRTPLATALRVALVRLFIAYRKGRGPDLSTAPIQARIGDDVRARSHLRSMCSTAAAISGRTVQSIQGELRRPWGVASVYRIALTSLSHTIARAQEIIDAGLRVRRLPAHKRQVDLPFTKPN